MTTYHDPYAATYFEPGCPECDRLWKQLLACNGFTDFETRTEHVTALIRMHAHDAHDITLAQPMKEKSA